MFKSLLRWSWRAFLLILIALTAIQFWFLVHVWYWVDHNPESTAFMRNRLEILQEEQSEGAAAPAVGAVSADLRAPEVAVVAAEDAKFVSHNGFDWEGIQKAYERISVKVKLSPADPPLPSNWRRICFSPVNARGGARVRRRLLRSCSKPS